jgi:hypothetical protein
MKKKRKQLSGSAKMTALGKKPVLLWLTPEQLDQVRRAAALSMRPVTQFVLFHAVQAAGAAGAAGARAAPAATSVIPPTQSPPKRT